jgi:hypothetical protein
MAAFGIVFVPDRAQPPVIFDPERVLPIRLEEVGLPDIGTDTGQEFADFFRRLIGGLSLALSGRIRFMSGNAGIGGPSEAAVSSLLLVCGDLREALRTTISCRKSENRLSCWI